MTAILRYAARVTRKKTSRKRTDRSQAVAIVGAGRLASFLAPALLDAGYPISEIVVRSRPRSLRRARALAAKVGAQAMTAQAAAIDAGILWFCVPDREIRSVAALIAHRALSGTRFAFHSSGALLSRELLPLQKAGVAVASVHPLMTFVAGAHPSLTGVPFAIEGDHAAAQVARQIVRKLGGQSFFLSAGRKAAYHAWATMTSPLLLAYLVTLEEAAHQAGLSRKDARRMSLPIIRQTLENYATRGPAHSFSGPFIRGDAETVAEHLALLKKHPGTRRVYVALAQIALSRLPVRNQVELRQLLKVRL